MAHHIAPLPLPAPAMSTITRCLKPPDRLGFVCTALMEAAHGLLDGPWDDRTLATRVDAIMLYYMGFADYQFTPDDLGLRDRASMLTVLRKTIERIQLGYDHEWPNENEFDDYISPLYRRVCRADVPSQDVALDNKWRTPCDKCASRP